MAVKNFITYLFGAGASAQTIPVTSQLKIRLNDLKVYLQSNFVTINQGALSQLHHHLREHQAELEKFISDIDWLLKETEDYDTIDVYAKNLYDRGSHTLNRLKMVLTFYFYFEQIVTFPSIISSEETEKYKKKIDSRYDNLLSQIADGQSVDIVFGEKIKILTWNYDMQIDMAIKKYTKKDIGSVKKDYHIYPNMNSYNDNDKFKVDVDKFCTIKLNGNAYFDNLGYNDSSLSHLLYDQTDNNLQTKIVKALLVYVSLFSRSDNHNSDNFNFFNFSWEKNGKYTGFNRTFEYVKEIANRTKILVISGYSFPTFNNLIDIQILNEMWPLEIYIQDENPTKIENRIKELMPNFNHSGDKAYPKIIFKHIGIDENFPLPTRHYHQI
jgi:hypothetical protein